MLKHKDHFHGSDLEKIEEIYGIKKEDITSFSANVNPLGVSNKLRENIANHIDTITTYPDREYTSLRKCIGNYINSDYENILVGNGSTELISLFLQIKAPKKALLIGPTYSEYEREINLYGGICRYHRLEENDDFNLNMSLLKNDLTPETDLLIICNPNNPTSSVITKDEMRLILDLCKERGIFVMVDETYVEFTKDLDNITSVALTEFYNNLIILRGVSKFFAAPGLRLGYAVCGNSDLLKEMNQRKNPWTINSLAACAGEIMFTDTNYQKETTNLIFNQRALVCKTLSSCKNIKYYPPAANFVLFKILKDNITSKDLFDIAIKKGLMIRDCSTFPFLDNKFVRFCFMSEDKNKELLDLILNELN